MLKTSRRLFAPQQMQTHRFDAGAGLREQPDRECTRTDRLQAAAEWLVQKTQVAAE
jgi:hypothetical protein